MPRVFTYPFTKTRTEAVVDQFDMFLLYTGIGDRSRKKILLGVEERWLQAVGVYLKNKTEKRILEAVIEIDWQAHSDFAAISPTVQADLPGWDSKAAPEIRVIGQRLGQKAKELKLKPNYWVRFTSDIMNDRRRHEELCQKVGVSLNSRIPDWESGPDHREFNLMDLEEVSVSIKEAQK